MNRMPPITWLSDKKGNSTLLIGKFKFLDYKIKTKKRWFGQIKDFVYVNGYAKEVNSWIIDCITKNPEYFTVPRLRQGLELLAKNWYKDNFDE